MASFHLFARTYGLLLLCIFLLTVSGRAQTVYEIQYKSLQPGDTNTVSAWFILDRNGMGTVRLRYADAKDITELRISEEIYINENGMPDTTTWYYEPVETKNVKGKSSSAPAPVIFWFRTFEDRGLIPFAVSAGKTLPAAPNIISSAIMDEAAVQAKRELVLTYYDNNSSYYKNLFVPSATGNKGNGDGITLHLWIVASTADETLLPNVSNDVERMQETFGYIANEMGYDFDTVTISGNNYNKDKLTSFLERAKAGKNDIVVFYYSGHGFRDQAVPTKEYPFLDLRNPNKRPRPDARTQTMNIQDIYNIIVKKGARLNLVLSDCCNDTIETAKAKGPVQPNTSKAPMNYVPANLFALFSKARHNLLMTAASKDERAIITSRYDSYFTYFFVESLNSLLGPSYSNPSWFQVLDETKKQTIKFAKLVTCPSGNKCVQTPKIFRR